MKAHTQDEVRAAKPRAQEVFERLARVVGVGITRIDAGYGLKVNLAQEPNQNMILPNEVDGVPVKVEFVGPIRKHLKGGVH